MVSYRARPTCQVFARRLRNPDTPLDLRTLVPQPLVFRGGSWRLPPQHQSAVTAALVDLCRKHGIPAKHCMQNLTETP